jgi:hypothetical protein
VQLLGFEFLHPSQRDQVVQKRFLLEF